MFVKLFETKDHGQILVKLDVRDDCNGPEVRVYFQPDNEALRVCSVALEFTETDKNWSLAEEVFSSFDLLSACLMVKNAKEQAAQLLGATNG